MSTVVTQPWDGSSSRFTIEQWKISCLLDTGTGDPDSKGRYRLPVREPNGNINRAACYNAAARLNQVDAPPDRKAAAARKLREIYANDLHEDVPDSLTGAAGRSRSVPDVERRTIGTLLEVRSGAVGSRKIGGYAAVFGQRSQPLGSFTEIVQNSFFNKSKSDGWPNVICRANHQDEMLLGTTASGTLRLAVDSVGLDYEADVPECRSDIWELVSTRRIAHSSFAFQVFDGGDDWKYDDGGPVRHLVSGRLIDTAPVVNPAYTGSSVSLRSLSKFTNCPYDQVEKYAAQGELRRLFTRTDNRGPLSGIAARKQLIHLRYPQSPAQKLIDIEGRRWPSKPLTPQQRQINVLGRWQPTL